MARSASALLRTHQSQRVIGERVPPGVRRSGTDHLCATGPPAWHPFADGVVDPLAATSGELGRRYQSGWPTIDEQHVELCRYVGDLEQGALLRRAVAKV